MVKHLRIKTMLLLGLLLAGVGTAWADSYTITFGNSAKGATNISSSTKASTVISSGTNYVTSQPFTVNSGSVFYGDTQTTIRIGASKKSASLTIALSDAGNVKATSIVVNCKYYSSANSSATLNVNSIGAQSTTSSDSDLTFTLSGDDTIESITLAGTAAIYVNSITVNYGSDSGGGSGTDTESEAAVTFDFATNIFDIPSGSSSKTADENSYTYNDYTITLVGGGTSNGYYYSNSYLMIGKSGATLTFPAFSFCVSKIKIYGTNSNASGNVSMNIYVGEEAVSTSAKSSQTDHDFEIAAGKQAEGTIYTLKIENAYNAQISKIEIFGYENISVTDAGYATYASDNALDYSDVTGLTAYTAKVSGAAVSFTKAGQVPGGEGVLLKGDAATYQVPVVETAAAITNDFVRGTGSTVQSFDGTNYNFILNKVDGVVAFYAANGKTVAKNRAYLQTTTNPAGARISLPFGDGETTGISDATRLMNRSEVYDLQGRVAEPTHGLYIVNGKKVFIK